MSSKWQDSGKAVESKGSEETSEEDLKTTYSVSTLERFVILCHTSACGSTIVEGSVLKRLFTK